MNYKELKIWDKAIELVRQIYIETNNFPESEKFNLTSQMRRCAVSVSSNIAEGAGRNSPAQFVNFLSISKGSAYELESQVILSEMLGFISKESSQEIQEKIDHYCRMNQKLQNHYKQA